MIEWRFADNKSDQFPKLAAELVQLNVVAIVTTSSSGTRNALNVPTTIPIVMANVSSPVENGFVASLAHPGGNVTGLTNILGDLGPKHLEMLHSMVPAPSRVAVLMNPTNPTSANILRTIQAAVRNTTLSLITVEAQTAPEITNAFSTMARSKAGAVIVFSDGLFNENRRQVKVAELAVKHRLPSITVIREYAEVGGLVSYGPNYADAYRRAATYVDKIIKGAKPGDLPVEQPMKFEMIINGKTAQALGLNIPQSLLISADKVIE